MAASMGGVVASSARLSLSNEGAFWSAEMSFPTDPGGDGAFVQVSDQQGGVLFGFIRGGVSYSGGLYHATVIARANNYRAREAAVLPNDDPFNLFRNPDAPIDAATALAARSAIVHWDRTGAAVLADIINGLGHLNIGKNYVAGTLNVSTADSMIGAVNLVMPAEWQENRVFKANFENQVGTLQDDVAEEEIHKLYGQTIGSYTVYHASTSAFAYVDPDLNYTRPYRVSLAKNPTNKIRAARGSNQTKTRAYLTSLPRRFINYTVKAVAMGTCKRREVLVARVQYNVPAGIDSTEEDLTISVGNLDRGGQNPDWQPGVAYSLEDRVDVDGVSWRCITDHVSDIEPVVDPELNPDAEPGGNFYEDVEFWAPVSSEPTAIGGDFQEMFYGAGAAGISAKNFGLNQAAAKIRAASRIYTISFDVPWSYVRALQGYETVTVDGLNGKVSSIEADLISGIATVTLKAVPYAPGGDMPGIPEYVPYPLRARGTSKAIHRNTYVEQEAVLAAYEYTQAVEDAEVAREAQIKAQEAQGNFQNHVNDGQKSIQQLIDANKTEIEFVTPSVPKGKEYSVIIDLGTINI